MYKSKLLNAVLDAVFAAALVFVITACDLPAADALLDGTWIAVSGARLEFTSGKFTRTLVTGGVENGTYTAGEGYITFNRSGYTPETLPYNLNGACLTIDITEYYHDSFGIAEDIEGRWTPYPDYGSALIFHKGKPQKGNPKIIEGEYTEMMASKGKYTISNRNLPGSNVLHTIPTHVHGSSISTFVEAQLRVSLLELFDLELLKTPGYNTEDWWFTLDETKNFFESAAGKAKTLEDQSLIISALKYFFVMIEPQAYDYSIEEDKDLYYTYTTVARGKNKLTLRENSAYGPYIFSYFKLKDDFGSIGPDPNGPENPFPINPIDPDDPNKGGFQPIVPH
jgi:hypothetical protein